MLVLLRRALQLALQLLLLAPSLSEPRLTLAKADSEPTERAEVSSDGGSLILTAPGGARFAFSSQPHVACAGEEVEVMGPSTQNLSNPNLKLNPAGHLKWFEESPPHVKMHEWRNMWERLDRTFPHTDGVCGQGMTLEEYIHWYNEFIDERTAWGVENTETQTNPTTGDLLNVESLW